MPFVTGPYGDINPLYLRTYLYVYSCSRALEKCWSWVDLVSTAAEVFRSCVLISSHAPTHPGEVGCRPSCGVVCLCWEVTAVLLSAVCCVFASALEQYSPSEKDLVRRAWVGCVCARLRGISAAGGRAICACALLLLMCSYPACLLYSCVCAAVQQSDCAVCTRTVHRSGVREQAVA